MVRKGFVDFEDFHNSYIEKIAETIQGLQYLDAEQKQLLADEIYKNINGETQIVAYVVKGNELQVDEVKKFISSNSTVLTALVFEYEEE